MANYEGTIFKATNRQLNKLKSAAKNKTGTTFTITKKKFQDGLSHESFLTTRQRTKIRNVFADNMLTDKKLSKAQLAVTIQVDFFII